MGDGTGGLGSRVRADELLAFQRDLKEEKEVLNKLLAQIDEQVHALQVEQLHLLGLMNKSLQPTETREEKSPEKETAALDLSVAVAPGRFEEEVEEDDDEDEDL